MKTTQCLCIALLAAVSLFCGCSSSGLSARAGLPETAYTSAQPMSRAGLPNFYRVSDTLYRGAQPEREGFEYLDSIGVKTVVDLCLFHSDEKDLEGTSLRYVGIPMAPWDPKADQLREFLTVVTDPANQPVFLHCRRGADRTGTFVAAYRMAVEGWSVDRAIAEMTQGPFDFNPFWSGLPRFLRKLDIEDLRGEFSPASGRSPAGEMREATCAAGAK